MTQDVGVSERILKGQRLHPTSIESFNKHQNGQSDSEVETLNPKTKPFDDYHKDRSK